MLGREGHVGEDVVLGLVHERRQLRPAPAHLVGHMAPGRSGLFAVGLVERLADRGRDDRVLPTRDVGQRIPDPVNAGAVEKRPTL